MNIGLRIKAKREERNMTLEELSKYAKVTRQTLSRYETGVISNIPSDNIERIANTLQTTPAYLMGWEEAPSLPSNLLPPPGFIKRPVLGRIACGTPIFCAENYEGDVNVPENIRCDYVLLAEGDSMTGAGIRSGDIVYIKKQEEADNGQIAACLLMDEERVTLKRFYRSGSIITLMPENPAYEPIVVTPGMQLRIIGVAVGYTHFII